MRTRSTLALTLLALPLVTLSGGAQAADDPALAGLLKEGPQALLAAADKRLAGWKDQTIHVVMTAHGPTDEGKQIEMNIFTKGNRRAMRFLRPADIKGMGVVVKGADEIYVRLPGARKARRVAAHARKQGLQGTDYAFDDSSLINLSPNFDAKLKGQNDKDVELELNRKKGSPITYPKLDVKIDRATLTVHFIQYYDDDLKKLKTEDRQVPPHAHGNKLFTYKVIKLVHQQKEHSTDLDVKKVELDTGLKDKMFSKRWLVRGL